MTNELKKVELTNTEGYPRRFTVASNVAITKGSLLKLTDPRTASQSDGAADPIAGIAAMEKANDDFSTSISVWTDGVFEALASGVITVGQPLQSSDGSTINSVMVTGAAGAASGAAIIGYALETAADEETINIRVRV